MLCPSSPRMAFTIFALRKNQVPAAVPHIVSVKAIHLKLMGKIISDTPDGSQLFICLLAVHPEVDPENETVG
jgi:hypothetical protein